MEFIQIFDVRRDGSFDGLEVEVDPGGDERVQGADAAYNRAEFPWVFVDFDESLKVGTLCLVWRMACSKNICSL